MYIVLRDDKIIAAHDDLDVVSEYVIHQPSKDIMRILKIKKQKADALLEEISEFENLYLVRYGDSYLPYDQYLIIKNISQQRDYDMKYCVDILYRILEENIPQSKKDIAAIHRVIYILENEIESLDDSDYDKLESIKKDFNL